MNKLTFKNDMYTFNNIKQFNCIRTFKPKSIIKAFNFAFDMSFGGKGEHRDHRSGGNHKRKNGEIFINTFQGKLAEFGIYNEFLKMNFKIPYPDLETYDLGIWDNYDFKVNNKKIAVKSTKPFGQLLLLETKDWSNTGEYIPNINTENSIYDYFILVRVAAESKSFKEDFKPLKDGESLMKKHKLLYSNVVNKNILESIILNFNWSYDIPGFITHKDLVSTIKENCILPKGSTLGKNTVMDAENYYIQTGDMTDIDKIFSLLKITNTIK